MTTALAIAGDSVIPQLGEVDTRSAPGQLSTSHTVHAANPASPSVSEASGSLDTDDSNDANHDSDATTGSESHGDDGDNDDDALDRAQGLQKQSHHSSDSDSGAEEGQQDEQAGLGPSSEATAAGGLLAARKAAGLAQQMERIMKAAARAAGRGQADPAQLVLSASQSSAKRQADSAAADAAALEAKRMRKMLKTRGRQTVPKAGSDPAQDTSERMLARIATSGVVRLFNAVTKAQAAQKEALLSGAKGKAVLSKSDFFQQLKAGTSGKVAPPPTAAAAVHEEGTAAWDVLKEGYTGLPGGRKMKDWDAAESDSEGDDDDLSDLPHGDPDSD